MRPDRNLGLVTALLVAFCSPAAGQNVENGQRAFNKCRACHDIGAGARNRVGPALTGVVGRRAGALEGFNYSEAMKQSGTSGLVWTEEKLSEYLAAPGKLLPRTKMAFTGIADQAERRDIIAYIKSVR